MAFAFRRDESIAEGAARVAGRQLDKAIGALDQAEGDGLGAIAHGVRKRTKRVRAVARLVQPGIGTGYRQANRAARDAAAELSGVRDAAALLGTFDALVAAGPAGVSADLEPVRHRLSGRVDESLLVEVDVEATIAQLSEARRAVDGWAFDDGVSVLGLGLDATYRRGRDGFRATLDERTPETFHEWRKATKHLWHQTQLLALAAPSSLPRQAHAFHALADALGDDHDLAVLVDLLVTDPESYGGTEPVEAAIALAEARRTDLEDRARRLGARLYVEKPKAFVARMTGLWVAWIDHGDERPVGEIAGVEGEGG